MPKFKIGDVIVHKGDPTDTREVAAIGKTNYFVRLSLNGQEVSNGIELIDSKFILKPNEVTITKEDLARAWNVALPFSNDSKNSASFDAICKELGLK